MSDDVGNLGPSFPGPAASDPAELLRRARALAAAAPNGPPGPGGLVAALVGGTSRGRIRAADALAAALDRPLFRLDLDRLAIVNGGDLGSPPAVTRGITDGIAPSIAQLLDAAVTGEALALVDGADLLLPSPGRDPGVRDADRWSLDVCALAVRQRLRHHPGIVLLDVATLERLHPVVVEELDLTVSVRDEPRR